MEKAFIFDVFGTLVDWRGSVAGIAKTAFRDRGIDLDPHKFADIWRSLYGPAMNRVRSGQRGYIPLDILHRENLDEALVSFGIADASDDAARAELNKAWERLSPWPDVIEGLDRLRLRLPSTLFKWFSGALGAPRTFCWFAMGRHRWSRDSPRLQAEARSVSRVSARSWAFCTSCRYGCIAQWRFGCGCSSRVANSVFSTPN